MAARTIFKGPRSKEPPDPGPALAEIERIDQDDPGEGLTMIVGDQPADDITAMKSIVTPDRRSTVAEKRTERRWIALLGKISRPIWRLVVVLSALLSILGLGAYQIWDRFDDDPLEIGKSGESGPLIITPHAVTCGKTVKDIPKRVRDQLPDELEQSLDQVCFVPTDVRNNSDIQLPGILNTALLVRDQRYPGLTASPLIPPLLSPDHSSQTSFIFSIPAGVKPTELRISSAVSLKKSKSPELGYVVR